VCAYQHKAKIYVHACSEQCLSSFFKLADHTGPPIHNDILSHQPTRWEFREVDKSANQYISAQTRNHIGVANNSDHTCAKNVQIYTHRLKIYLFVQTSNLPCSTFSFLVTFVLYHFLAICLQSTQLAV